MRQRIVTAIIAILVLVPVILYGKLPFLLFAVLFAGITLFEFSRMISHKHKWFYFSVSIIFVLSLIFMDTPYFQLAQYISFETIVAVAIVIILALVVLSKNRFTFEKAGTLIAVIFFTGLAYQGLIAARFEGLNYILFILFIIWATDSGAYFVGRSLGKRKLWPEISPNKTVGGAVGGIFMALIVGIVFQLAYPFPYHFMTIIGVTLLITLFGQIGDLVASAIKRFYHVKDSGTIFPGHGGVLDRLDSLLFVLIVLSIVGFI